MEDKNVLDVQAKEIPVSIQDNFDPKEYFQEEKKGLYVSSGFKERILEKASPIAEGKNASLSSFTLTEYATDEEIEAALPEKHFFSESEVCAVIATLLEQQPEGKDGVLDSKGNWNLFYTENFVVDVDWGDDEWYVCAWDRDDGGWFSDGRVFSPAN